MITPAEKGFEMNINESWCYPIEFVLNDFSNNLGCGKRIGP